MKTSAKPDGLILTYLLGLLLAGGILFALVYPFYRDGAQWGGSEILYPLDDLTLLVQQYAGWGLLALVLLAALGCLACPSERRFRQKGETLREAGRKLWIPSFLGFVIFLAEVAALCVPSVFNGLQLFAKEHLVLTIAAAAVLVLVQYILGSRAVPLVRTVEGSEDKIPSSLRIFEGVMVAVFCGIVILPVYKTLRVYLLPLAVLLALLPGTLAEWRIARRGSGLRPMYLALRALRGIGMVVGFPFTLAALVYALVARKQYLAN